MTKAEEGDVAASFALMSTLRRLMRRQPASTQVTVTRVVGAHVDEEGDPVPETVVVTTAEPLKDTAAHRVARTALVVSSVALALTTVTIAYRMIRHEIRHHR